MPGVELLELHCGIRNITCRLCYIAYIRTKERNRDRDVTTMVKREEEEGRKTAQGYCYSISFFFFSVHVAIHTLGTYIHDPLSRTDITEQNKKKKKKTAN